MKRYLTLLTVLISLTFRAIPGFALDVEEAENLVLYFENDTFGGTDKNYSNAVKLTWISKDIDKYIDGYKAADPFLLGGFWSGEGYQRNLSFSLGQNIYTPEDSERKELVKNDRPYAGLLYLAFALHRKNETVLDSLELTLGIIGPASLAEESQRFVHDIMGIDSPRGWDNQLENELGIALSWQHSWRMLELARPSGWGWDLIPHFGLTAGNIATFINAGFGVRFGYNVPRDFGTSLIRPAGNIPAPTSVSDPRLNEKRDFGFVCFAGAEGRAVAYNVFLDGNTFTESHSVDKEFFVADFNAGVSISYKALKLTYAHVYRSKDFEDQDGGQVFGSIVLSITY